jgi:cell shape-determining protein MreC
MADRLASKRRLTQAEAVLAAGLALSAVLAALPPRWLEPAKRLVEDLLYPGQAAVGRLCRAARPLADLARDHGDWASRLVERDRECRRLEEENHRLAAELATAREQGRASSGGLLSTRYLPAHVLGRQARSFLARRDLLDLGSREGVEAEALVVDLRPGLIDRGRDAGLSPDRLVLSGGCAWGKIASVGRFTSTVRTVTENGFRDLVWLGRPPGTAGGPPPVQGLLEGTGEPRARVRFVDATEPVAVGDVVYCAAAGLIESPPQYGRLVRAEHPAGAAYWELWMEPAVSGREVERVAVLRAELNPARVGLSK